MTHETASALPVMIAIAEFENPLLDLYGLELAYRIAVARRRSSRFHVYSVGRKRLAPVQTLRADWRNLLDWQLGRSWVALAEDYRASRRERGHGIDAGQRPTRRTISSDDIAKMAEAAALAVATSSRPDRSSINLLQAIAAARQRK